MSTEIVQSRSDQSDLDRVLPLPPWLKRAYYLFPVILYVPDAIFNFWVYSDGVKRTGSAFFDAAQMVLWACVSLGVVGMAYLLSVIAPWHWRNGHKVQAFFCGLGVVIATAVTTWNSLSYRSSGFTAFKTDTWANSLWPQLSASGVSLTMVLVSIAPPFWGLFWAIVQPIDLHRGLDHLKLGHEERLLRAQQDAELKALRADTKALVRAAQLKGMAQTAAAAREQAKTLFARGEAKGDKGGTLAGTEHERERSSTSAPAPALTPAVSASVLRPLAPVAPTTPARERAREASRSGRRSASPTARGADLSHLHYAGDDLSATP